MASSILPSPVVLPISDADIKDELWLEVARYHVGAGPPREASQLQGRPSRMESDTLSVLLGLDGKEFVLGAYRTLLGREPDDAGTAYFMQQMAAGVSKIILLGQLGRSPEGRRAGRTLPGLRKRYLAHRLYALPILGGTARLTGAVLRRSGVSRALAEAGRPAVARRWPAHETAPGQTGATREAALGAGVDATSPEAALRRLAAQEEASFAVAASLAQQSRTLSGLVAQNLARERRLAGLEDSTIESLLTMSDAIEDQGARLSRLESLLNGEAVAAQIEAGAIAPRQLLDQRLSRAEAIVAQNRQAMIDQERRIGLMLEALRSRPEPMPTALQAEDDRAVETLYIDFEDRFRGTRADIKQRLRFYLPILAEAQAGTLARPVLDIGCGRGEFLELLRDEGLVGHGADVNVAMAAKCRDLGLDCVAEDALARLARQPTLTLGAVTGFHIVEHLPFKTMVRLFDAAMAALAPGGVLVFETPNPANLLVASRWFYLDPTHRNPLPGEMLAMIAEARGFCRVSIVELHPMEQRFGGNDRVLREQLDGLFHGPQDYALLARKP